MCIAFEGGEFGDNFLHVDVVQGVIKFCIRNIFGSDKVTLFK